MIRSKGKMGNAKSSGGGGLTQDLEGMRVMLGWMGQLVDDAIGRLNEAPQAKGRGPASTPKSRKSRPSRS